MRVATDLLLNNFNGMVPTMAKAPAPAPVLSPTVTTVFTDFAAKVEADAEVGKEVAERLRSALLTNRQFDPDNLRTALFGTEPKET